MTAPKNDPWKPLTEFEIGRIYRTRSKRYYLAMDTDLIVSYYDGKETRLHKLRPGWMVLNSMTSDELCAVWSIEFHQLDELTDRYLGPRKPDKSGDLRSPRRNAFAPLVYRLSNVPH